MHVLQIQDFNQIEHDGTMESENDSNDSIVGGFNVSTPWKNMRTSKWVPSSPIFRVNIKKNVFKPPPRIVFYQTLAELLFPQFDSAILESRQWLVVVAVVAVEQ